MAEALIPSDSNTTNQTNATDPQAKKEAVALRRWTMFGLSFAVVLGLLVSAIHGGTVTVSVAAFGAALGLGGVLGFLFGIPSPGGTKPSVKINQVNAAGVVEGGQGGGAGAAAANLPSTSLTLPAQSPGSGAGAGKTPGSPGGATAPAATGQVSNLEQVADWVTKLLLGGGLTQMQRIPPKIWQWSHAVAVGILGRPTGIVEQVIVAEQAFACGLMVYGFILGFFAGFLITKLQLGNAIAD